MGKVIKNIEPEKVFLELIKDYETNDAIDILSYLSKETKRLPNAEEIAFAFLDDLQEYKIFRNDEVEDEISYFVVLVAKMSEELEHVYIALRKEDNQWKIHDFVFRYYSEGESSFSSMFNRNISVCEKE